MDTTGQELTTKRGDTLSAIAREMQVEGVSLDQMLVGLYENNKEAFDKGNMNRLKVGQIIKVPSKDALTSVGQPEAKKTIKIHSANWNAYRNALAGNVEAAPAKVEAEQKQSSTGKIATAVDKAAPVASGPKDVVKLSAGDKAAKDSAKSAEAKIAALQEETTARENSVKEANDRAAALEKQIADMQKLIAMKSQSMADMQKNAEAASKKPEATDKPKEVAKVEVTPPVEVKPTEVKPAEVMPPAEVKVAEPMPAAEVKPAEVMVEAKTKVKKPVVVPPPVVEEPGFLSGLLSSFDLTDLTVLGGAGGAALLGGGWMYLRNKRRKDLDSFERGILTSGGLRANTVFGNTTGNASMSDTSFLTDFAQSADGSMIDTNDVDPIAEAEVYMAYGRDAQAEEILKDAITKEPKRYELHLKLLELYAARKDNSAFEAIAGELYTTLGSSDPTWAKVVVMGAELEPGNPLYKSTSVSSVDTLSTQKLDAEDFSDMAVAESSDLDFSLDDDSVGAELANEDAASNAVMQSFAGAKDVESEISFDLGSLDENANEQGADISNEVAITPVTAESASENLMDFDLSSFSEPVETALQETVNEISLPDITDEALVLNGPTISNVAETSLSSATDFDMDFNLPDTSEIASKVASNAVAPSVMEDISFDIDLPNEEQLAPALTQMAADASEISFDLPVIEEPVAASVESAVQSTSLEANAFDLLCN